MWLPLEIALVHSRTSGATARKAIGLLVAVLTIGGMAGTVLAGVVDAVSGSLTVTLLVPGVLCLLTSLVVFTKVPESTARSDRKVDGVGFATLAIAMVLLLWGLRMVGEVGITSPATYVSLLVAAVVFAFFVWWELRVEAPAIDIKLVTSRALGPLYIVGLCYGFVVFGSLAPLTLFLAADPARVGYGFAAQPPLIAGLSAGLALLACVGAVGFAFLASRVGMKLLLLAGVTLPGVGSLFQFFFHDELWHIWIATLLSGLGYGLLSGALPALLAELAPADATGVASGVYNSIRTLAGSIAGAAFAVALSTYVDSAGVPLISGYMMIWMTSAILFAVAVVAICLTRTRSSDTNRCVSESRVTE
ncbi:MFS transporter [Nonomuraea antimicrobica]|uniref:MFS transporter n=1 Tax=Nonomuraea antimicrobica TaxID=561173 RepID=UPI0031EF5ACF